MRNTIKFSPIFYKILINIRIILNKKFAIIFILAFMMSLFLVFSTPSAPYLFKKRSFSLPPQLPETSTLNNVVFKDITYESGLLFFHQQGDEKLTGIDETLGSGACAFDYDNDGWVDLFLVNGLGQTRYFGKQHWWQDQQSHQLFKNMDGQHFKKVTRVTGLEKSSWGMGCVTADFDNDGDQDLVITNKGENIFYRNNGDNTFTDITKTTGITGKNWSTSATVADFDKDGLLDLYIANYIQFKKGASTYEGNSRFSFDKNIPFKPQLFDSVGNKLYKNVGNLTFKEVTEEMGLGNSSGRSLSAQWVDVNHDQYMDLLITNDLGSGADQLWLNQQGKHFKQQSTQSMLLRGLPSHDFIYGDFDNNLQSDLIINSNQVNNISLLLAKKKGFIPAARKWNLAHSSTTLLNGWGMGGYDFNNDGLLDVFMATGFLIPDADVNHIPLGQPNQIWLNTGRYTFQNTQVSAGTAFSHSQSSRGSVFADFDNDGDMDIYIANNNDLGQLLRNDTVTKNNWLGVKLVGDSHNRDAIGAKVYLTTEKSQQMRIVSAGNSFLSDSDRRILFGLGQESQVKSLKIEWPEDHLETFNDIAPNQFIKVQQHKGIEPIHTLNRAKQKKFPIIKRSLNVKILSLKLLIREQGLEKSLPRINALFSDISPKVIEFLSAYSHPKIMALLIKTLEHQETSTVKAAIKSLCHYEDETTSRWLLAQLNHSNNAVKITTANCFQFLFQEEEAMVYRKYLAVPFLIRLLDDVNPDVQIAAIYALAEAEKFRAVLPLIKHLKDKNQKVVAQIARALGLIRENIAIKPLLKQLQSPSHSADVYASLLVALKRLNPNNFPTLLAHFTQGFKPFENIPITLRLQALFSISALKEDSVAINSREILHAIKPLITQKKMLNDTIILHLIPLLTLQNDKTSLLFLKKLTSHRQSNIRYKALRQLYALKIDIISLVLQDPDAKTRNLMLSLFIRDNHSLMDSFLLKLVKVQATRQNAIRLMANSNSKVIAQFLVQMLTKEGSIDDVVLALNSLRRIKVISFKVPEKLFSSPSPLIRQAVFLYWENQQDRLLKEMPEKFKLLSKDDSKIVKETVLLKLALRKELWAVNKIKTVLFHNIEKVNIKEKLLTQFKDPFHKPWLLLQKIIQQKNNSLHAQALKALQNFKNAISTQIFTDILASKNSPDRAIALAYFIQHKDIPFPAHLINAL